MRPVSERIGSSETLYRVMNDTASAKLRCAMPGIIKTFDPETQTVTIQPAIRETISIDGERQEVEIPLLLDVPVYFPRAGGYSLTLPVREGDECLVIFADTCIDAWFSLGGVQKSLENRRHDLSDAFALVGVWSQPHRIENYYMEGARLSCESGASIGICKDKILLNGNIQLTDSVKLTGNIEIGNAITLTGDVNINGNLRINGERYEISKT